MGWSCSINQSEDTMFKLKLYRKQKRYTKRLNKSGFNENQLNENENDNFFIFYLILGFNKMFVIKLNLRCVYYSSYILNIIIRRSFSFSIHPTFSDLVRNWEDHNSILCGSIKNMSVLF